MLFIFYTHVVSMDRKLYPILYNIHTTITCPNTYNLLTFNILLALILNQLQSLYLNKFVFTIIFR